MGQQGLFDKGRRRGNSYVRYEERLRKLEAHQESRRERKKRNRGEIPKEVILRREYPPASGDEAPTLPPSNPALIDLLEYVQRTMPGSGRVPKGDPRKEIVTRELTRLERALSGGDGKGVILQTNGQAGRFRGVSFSVSPRHTLTVRLQETEGVTGLDTGLIFPKGKYRMPTGHEPVVVYKTEPTYAATEAPTETRLERRAWDDYKS